MAAQKHTPGPWWIAGKGTIRWGDPNSINTGWIGTVNWRNREQNARLISAAPEMLEALMLAEELYQLGIINASSELIDRVASTRRAAIAKATGQ